MKRFVPVEALFQERHFDGEIIVLCVGWCNLPDSGCAGADTLVQLADL
jgi:hypothetical protein